MIVRVCACGNTLRTEVSTADFTMRTSPCRCAKPGLQRGHVGPTPDPRWLKSSQVKQRDALGLPRVAPMERDPARWV